VYKILVGNFGRKKSLGRVTSKSDGYINIVLKAVGCEGVHLIYVDEDVKQCRRF
jgi:hypothetical protein